MAASRSDRVRPAKKSQGLAHGHAADPIDGQPLYLHVTRLAAQAGAAAIRACLVGAIPAEEDADVHLVLLALEQREEAAHALIGAVTVDDEGPLLRR